MLREGLEAVKGRVYRGSSTGVDFYPFFLYIVYVWGMV